MSAPPVKRACDACHKRKVRCSGGQPCRNCGQASLQCTYNAIPQKKGPKGSRAKVISEIRDNQHQSSVLHGHGMQNYAAEGNPFDFNTLPVSPSSRKDERRLSKQTIDSCMTFFFAYLHPTMPIFHRQRLEEVVKSHRDTSAEVYCLIAALCAFVMVQPGMTLPGTPGSPEGTTMDGETAQSRYNHASALLEELLQIRKSLDYVESPSLTTVQTSFFLFASFFGLEKQNSAWYHLREATTLAQIQGMHEEATYLTGDQVENMYRRRLYWLLLLTERAYAMERHRPLTLHGTIELPTLDEDPGDVAVVSGFLHLVNLFRLFDDEFIGLWNKSKSDCSTTWLAQLQQELADALPPKLNTIESQVADIKVTQQWLRTMVWQLSITNGFLSSTSPDSSMTFKFPIEIAKDLIKDLNALSQQSMEVHGVGLIEKLFDVACTLTDVIACVPLDGTVFDSLPSDYLNQFLMLISRLRGGASRFLPLLLAKISENLPSMSGPIHHMPLAIGEDYASKHPDSPLIAHSAPSVALPGSPYGAPPSAVSDSSIVFSAYSPSANSSNGPGLTPINTPSVLAPIPRSVPRVPFEGYPG